MLLPLREGRRSRVSLESRYGICIFSPPASLPLLPPPPPTKSWLEKDDDRLGVAALPVELSPPRPATALLDANRRTEEGASSLPPVGAGGLLGVGAAYTAVGGGSEALPPPASSPPAAAASMETTRAKWLRDVLM